jgi:hypothetical protein
MKWLLSFLLLFYLVEVHAQQSKVNQLKFALSQARADTDRVLLMDTLIYYYSFYAPNSSFSYARKAIGLSQSINYINGKFAGYFWLGLASIILGRFRLLAGFFPVHSRSRQNSKNCLSSSTSLIQAQPALVRRMV